MIKKILLFAALAVIGMQSLLLIVPRAAYAVNVLDPACANPNATTQPTLCKENDAAKAGGDPLLGPNGILTKATQGLVILIAAFAVFVIIIAGIRIIVSNGDSNTIATMRQAIIAAVVGLIIAGMAQVIVIFILSQV